MNIGEYDASKLALVYVFTYCDYIELYKNEEYINTFYPNKDEFNYLPHPPIIVDDFIGNQLSEQEGFSKRDEKRIKDVFHLMLKHDKLPIMGLLKMEYVMLKNKINYQSAYSLYTKYVAMWGHESIKYHFKGYKDGKVVCESTKGPSFRKSISVSFSSSTLIEEFTYDVLRIELKALDEHDNLLSYAFLPITIETIGPIEVNGPKQISLVGGSIAFWVKSVGSSGNAKVTINSLFDETKEIKLNVIKRKKNSIIFRVLFFHRYQYTSLMSH